MNWINRLMQPAVFATGVLLACAVVPAKATLLNFDSLTPSTSSFQVNGDWKLTFSGTSYGSFGSSSTSEGVGSNAINGNGGTRLGAAGPQNGAGARITLQNLNGLNFSVQAFDAANFLAGFGVRNMLIGYTTASNVDVWDQVSIDDSFDTYYLSSVGPISRLWFTEPAAFAFGSSGGVAIDNIRVNEPGFTPPTATPTVPEPATLALVAAALAGVAASRRRTTGGSLGHRTGLRSV